MSDPDHDPAAAFDDSTPGPPGPASRPASPGPGAGSVPGERHVSEVAGRRRGVGKATGVGVLVAGSVLACGVILLTAERPDLAAEDGAPPLPRPAVRFEPPPLPPPIEQAALPLAPAVPPPPRPAASPAGEGAAPRQPRLLVYTAGVRGSQPAAAAPADGLEDGPPDGPTAVPGDGARLAGGGAGDDLAARLRPTPLAGVAARVLRHQPYLLTTGTMIPCILQTAMDSSLPGLVSCLVPQDVLGKSGLTLLDRGTRVVGQFRGGVQQGVERMFVVWTRAETPQGVVIALDSPATDPLGRSGLEGAVDRHFWQRFGGALLLSTVDGAIQAGVAAAAKEGTTTINTGQTQAVIAESLRGSIAIPPTVRKNQGELVSILVARDLDFSGVYAIAPAAGAPPVAEPGR